MSWTDDLAVARRFAQRAAVQGPAYVRSATVPPETVLARFATSAETEAVVNPDGLRGRVEVVEEVEAEADRLPCFAPRRARRTGEARHRPSRLLLVYKPPPRPRRARTHETESAGQTGGRCRARTCDLRLVRAALFPLS